jgi:erythronate-4-phosphate dehydrogenase
VLIIADENIPFAREAFGPLGEVRLVAGRAIAPDAVREADALLVRSVTRVNAALLANTRVKFVGTATIGTDHIDLDYLQQKGIAFASAAGCNANSVAEYVVAALLHIAVQRQIVLEGMTLGVVGAGNVGSRVAEKARALGLKVMLNDPPLAELIFSHSPSTLSFDQQQNFSRLAGLPFHSLEELMAADIITLHTPLVRRGPHPTFHLFDEKRLRQMKNGAVLLNTARGEVIDTLALKKALRKARLSAAVLDVWEHEPHIDPELVELTTLATPHIAGYSFDGKVKGTWLIYEALCRFLQIAPGWNSEALLPPVLQPEIYLREDEFNALHASEKIPPLRGAGGCDDLTNSDCSEEQHPPQGGNLKLLHKAVRQAYDIAADDNRLRAGILREGLSQEERGKYFDKLRHEYPIRREFQNYRVQLENADNLLTERLRALGFRVGLEP